jgi:TolB-like protein
MYEMITGTRPFHGDGAAELMSSILRDDPAAVESRRIGTPPRLSRLITRCLHKDPAQRIRTALDIHCELESIRDEEHASGRGEPDDHPRSASSTAPRALAVLPLANLSGDPSEEYFADGMTEALITDISKVSRLKVISRTSVMQYKGVNRPIAEIANELGVDTIVEGSVLRAGDRVRISAQLIRAATDEHLWAERYDRNLEDVLALQDEVARAIASQIDATLGRPDSSVPQPPRKVDPEVYRLLLKGRHYWNMRTEESSRSALECFRRAIDIDPTYAPAHVGVADSLNMIANYGIQPPGSLHRQSLAAAEMALELDGRSSDAYRARALIRWQFEFEWDKAIDDYERALELDPHSPLTTYWYGVYLSVIGSFEKSWRMLDRAEELDPLSLLIPSVKGWVRVFARKPEEAVPFCRRVLEINPNYFAAHWFLGEALVELGDHEGGIAALKTALELSGRIARFFSYLGYAYGRAGRAEEARAMLAELDSRSATQYVAPYFFAIVHSGLEETDLALARLEQAYEERDAMIRDLKADPRWDRLRSEPRFQALMEKMNYPNPPEFEFGARF